MKKIVLLLVLNFIAISAYGLEILSVHPFELQEAKIHQWEQEKTAYKHGSLILARVQKGEFQISQAFNPQVIVEGRILERLDSGENASVVAFIFPGQITKDHFDFSVKNEMRLPEQVSRVESQKIFNRSKFFRQTNRFRIANKRVVKMKGERQLYNWIGSELTKKDPAVRNYIQHWFIN